MTRLPPQKTGQRCDSRPPGEVSCPASTVLAGHLSQSTIEAARPLESPQAITRHEAIPRPKRAYHAEHPIRLQREEGPSDTRGSRPSKRARTTPDSAARGLGGGWLPARPLTLPVHATSQRATELLTHDAAATAPTQSAEYPTVPLHSLTPASLKGGVSRAIYYYCYSGTIRGSIPRVQYTQINIYYILL